MQHEIFENEKTVVWEDDGALKIKVNCRAVADEVLAERIPYALMVSFEIKSDIDIDVYARIADRISPRVTPKP